MKTKRKLIITLLLIIFTIAILSNITFATSLTDLDAPASSEFDNIGNAAVKILTTIGMVASVVTLIVLGIKYMMGSVEERAAYKKTLMPYFIGGILVFGASSIASIVYNIAKDL